MYGQGAPTVSPRPCAVTVLATAAGNNRLCGLCGMHCVRFSASSNSVLSGVAFSTVATSGGSVTVSTDDVGLSGQTTWDFRDRRRAISGQL